MADATRLTATRVPGLQNDVAINVDQWGVAHIRAENLHDLFFAQGWNAARDRLWQIDIARKRGLGLLARILVPAILSRTGPLDCFFIAVIWHRNGKHMGRIPRKSVPLLLKASTPMLTPAIQER